MMSLTHTLQDLERGYPESVTALLRAAGVLHAVPLDAGLYVRPSDDQLRAPSSARADPAEQGGLRDGMCCANEQRRCRMPWV